MSTKGPRRRGLAESVGQGRNRTRPGGSIEGNTQAIARLGEAMRSQQVRRAPAEQYGPVYVPGAVSFTFDAIEVQAASFTTGTDGVWEWSIIAKNEGLIDTVLVFADADGGLASYTAAASRVFAIDDKSWTLLGGPSLAVAAQPASYEAEAPFTFSVAVWAKPFSTTVSI